MNKSNVSLPNVIDGVTRSHNISNMLKSHYKDLYNCLNNDKDVSNLCKNVEYEIHIDVTQWDYSGHKTSES